ncbi:MAG: phosphoethanolamine--lipid A transferase [Betaproteobacteria bacterium]|nr:phosphoethanolamine--lipid A transferase [Betaproteobacteria bacterium]
MPRFPSLPALAATRLQWMFATALWCSLVPNLPTLAAFSRAPSAGEGLSWLAFVGGGWLFVFAVSFALLALVGAVFLGRTFKAAVVFLLLAASILSYFTLFLGTQFDRTMVLNLLQTHQAEALELVGPRLMAWVALTGILPAGLAWQVTLRPTTPWWRGAAGIALATVALVALATAGVYAQYPRYASATRNRAITFDTVAPWNLFAASIHLAASQWAAQTVRAPRGEDARQAYLLKKPRLTFFLLGETARAQNQGLNGYARDTTPRMKAAGGYYFPDTESCGTATAISVPCMFSGFGREAFSLRKGLANETLIDVLLRGGAQVWWRDNDSGCKGVCEKAEVIDLTGSSDPRWCTETASCFDEILLDGLEQRLSKVTRDTLVVLHLKGSHGPAYYKRYPPVFERFAPACQSNDLAACDPAALVNSYDNTILYTDHVVGESIAMLRRLNARFATALLYVSDHGESLGEGGLFLHGLPYALAPKEQTRVPMYAWVSPDFLKLENWDARCMAEQTRVPRSHDNVYSTILGLMEIETAEYKGELDLFGMCDWGVNHPKPAGKSP